MNNIIVWLRKDLRIHDHQALWEASQLGNVIPVFIWSPKEEKDLEESAATLWWLHHSLLALEDKLQKKGFPLIYRKGDTEAELIKMIQASKATAVFYHENYEPGIRERDKVLKGKLKERGVQVRSFHGHLLFSPYEIKNKQDAPYKVFTSFYKNLLHEAVARPLPTLEKNEGKPIQLDSLSIDDLDLLPRIRWDEKLHDAWQVGEDGAIEQFERFVQGGLASYEKGRDIPSEDNVSFLSPYLTWGNISVRAIWHAINREATANLRLSTPAEAFKRQLIWRDFAYHQLIHFPKMPHLALRESFAEFAWINDPDDLLAWQKGETGYPLVDAGMKELYARGIMHNRVRMVVASFLTKHLLIAWQEGSDYFSECLVDFDVANNAMGWQWVAGCGIETAPYFRIFNPILQSEKFDPRGYYIKKWLPALAKLPAKYIHQPWEAPQAVLEEAGVVLGVHYPERIIDHAFARKRALAAFDTIKNKK